MSATEAAKQAARMGDPIEHSVGLLGMLAGMVLGAVVGVILIAATVATGGGALALALAAVGAVGAVAGGGLAGGQLARGLGTLFHSSGITTGSINSACSPDVIIGFKPAARAVLDLGICDGLMTSYHVPLSAPAIAEGSSTVIINGMPAARQGDKLQCGAALQLGEPSVFIGGETIRILEVNDFESELEGVLTKVALGAAVAGALLLTGGYFAGAICGVVLLKAAGAATLFFAANSLLGQVGDALGPGWRDTLQGGTGVGTLLVSGYKGLRMFEGRPFFGEPIDMVTGEVCMKKTDFSLPATLPLVLNRIYMSGLNREDGFGPGWCTTWGQRLDSSGENLLYLTDDGRSIQFKAPATLQDEEKNPGAREFCLRRTEHGFLVETGAFQRLRFEHSLGSQWLLSGIEDLNGNVIHLQHDETGTLCGISHTQGYRLKVEGSDRKITRISTVDEHGGESTLIEYNYSSEGWLRSVVDATKLPFSYSHDAYGRVTRWEDRNGDWYSYQYDGEGRCIEAAGAEGMHHYRFSWDENNRTNSVLAPNGGKTTFIYNHRLQVEQLIQPDGGIFCTAWNKNGQKLEELDALGGITAYGYDPAGNLIRITDPDGYTTHVQYNSLRQPVFMRDALGQIWRRVYDKQGRLLVSEGPDGATWKYTYDEQGNNIELCDPTGQSRKRLYNTRGLLVEETDWLGNRAEYKYDQLGRLTVYTNRSGERELYEYDTAGRLVLMTQPLALKNYWQYDGEGNILNHTDPLQRTTHYRYNAFKQLRQIVKPSGGTIELEHDLEGRLSRVKNEVGDFYTLAYTTTGHVSQETDFAGRSLFFQYDLAGRCVAQTDAFQKTTHLEWSHCGQLLRKILPDGGEVSYRYDPLKRLVMAQNQSCEVILEWNPYGNLIKESQNGRSVESDFDLLGRRVKRRISSGQDCDFSYDGNGLLTGVALNGDLSLKMERDVAGREVLRRTSGGLIIQQGYDLLSRLSSQSVRMDGQSSEERGFRPSQRMLLERQYRFDPCSRLVEVIDNSSRRTSFQYEGSDLVAQALHATEASEFFEYDISGKIIRAIQRGLDGGTSFNGTRGYRNAPEYRTYDRGGRLRSTGSRRYEYDEMGQVVSRTDWHNSLRRQWRYEWDSEGRLQSVVTPDGQQWRYSYDPFGRRIEKSGPAGRTRYVWDGDVIAEVIEDGQESTTWVFEPDSFRALIVQRGGESFHAMNDHIGGLFKLFTKTGSLAWDAELSVWGETVHTQNQGFNCPLRYQGQWFDSESGLLYMRHRYYDPEANTFLSADPLGVWGEGQLYSFPLTPQNWIDPLGLAGPGYHTRQDHMVYGLYRGNESTPYYVGRTVDFGGTQSRHGNLQLGNNGVRLPAGSRMQVIHGGLSYNEARGLEQHYINQYGTKNGLWNGNQWNGVSEKNAKATDYHKAAMAKLGCGG